MGLLFMLPRLIFATAWLGIALLAASPVQAGSITRSSIWNQAAAMRAARSRVPRGAEITDSHCEQIAVANDFRWQCTVRFSMSPPSPAETPAAGSD